MGTAIAVEELTRIIKEEEEKCAKVFLIYKKVKLFYLGEVTTEFEKDYCTEFTDNHKFEYFVYLIRLKLGCVDTIPSSHICSYHKFHKLIFNYSHTGLTRLINSSITELNSKD